MDRALNGLGLLCGGFVALTLAGQAAAQVPAGAVADRPATDEIIYFLLPDRFENGDADNDRGGLAGDRLATGYDPTDRSFYHGGDLKGLTARLDYIQGLGATALWIAPIFANKPVQGPPGQESAAYHGYWITDFTRVDPHLGTNADFRALVEAAHARGMKVYLDIVINHTADVIQYRECRSWDCSYRGRAEYPATRRGGPAGEAINPGFDGADFGRLNRPDYAFTPFTPEGEASVKAPAWLNDTTLYHNRGNSLWFGESALDGDFSGLDDLYTENPRVVRGFIDLYGGWIRDYGIDGFRIDTAKHVNPEFWQAFVPAILEIAREAGRPNFHIFGEVYGFEPGELARHTRVDGLPAVLDFAVQDAIRDTVAGTEGPDRLARTFSGDVLYEGGERTALQLPTFTGNHDMGRIGHMLLAARPDITDDELLARATLAHALMMFSRGVPVLYYGDEQGFTGDGDDKRARQDMFATRTPDYADDRRIGQASGPFDTGADLYVSIAEMARLRQADPRLRHGRQVVRAADREPGLFALSRLDATGETLVLFNTSTMPLARQVVVDPGSRAWRAVRGSCAAEVSATGSLAVDVPPLDYVICISEGD
ncbi:MAG: alpha-amylase family glycosyl hydrolase [Brevundimonas sp.]